MNEVMAKGLEGALKAAVDSNGAAGSDNGGVAAGDLISLALKVLPKIIQNTEAREDLVELENEGVFALRKEVRFLRRQLRDLVQSQKGVLEELYLMRELQSTMVSHLSRVQIMEMPDDEEIDDAYDYADDLIAPTKQRGVGSRGLKRMKNNGRRNPRPR